MRQGIVQKQEDVTALHAHLPVQVSEPFHEQLVSHPDFFVCLPGDWDQLLVQVPETPWIFCLSNDQGM